MRKNYSVAFPKLTQFFLVILGALALLTHQMKEPGVCKHWKPKMTFVFIGNDIVLESSTETKDKQVLYKYTYLYICVYEMPCELGTLRIVQSHHLFGPTFFGALADLWPFLLCFGSRGSKNPKS